MTRKKEGMEIGSRVCDWRLGVKIVPVCKASLNAYVLMLRTAGPTHTLLQTEL